MLEQLFFRMSFGMEQFFVEYWKLETVYIFFPFFILFDLPRYLLTQVLSFLIHPRRKSSPVLMYRDEAKRWLFTTRPLVSVLVPAHNEEDTILATIRSLQEQTYDNLEIIVSDDCSKDKTYEICLPLARKGEIKLVRNKNQGGKSSAMNNALQFATGEFIVGIDSDTLFRRDSFENLLYHFVDPMVGAVGGNLRVLNTHFNITTALQTIEYLMSISTGRRFSSAAGVLLIISGAFGAYRRNLLQSVHGYSQGPGEDSDITTKMRKKKYRIVFAAAAVGFTKVPTTMYSVIKQRFRWNATVISVRLRKHINVLNPGWSTFNVSNLIGWIDLIFFQIVLSATFIAFLLFFINYSVRWFFTVAIIFELVAGFVRLISFSIAWSLNGRHKEDLFLFWYLPLFGIYKGYFIRMIRATAYVCELLFRVSYHLPFVPKNVRPQVERW